MTEKKIITDFQKMTEIDVSKRIQQKGKFNYLPWSDAHELMKKHDPNAIISIREFEHWMVVKGDRKEFLVSKELPYQTTNGGSYVEVSVLFKEVEETEIYPILDFKNNDVTSPTMTQVNKALKRAFVKALAKHGLGLYIYRGEDLPEPPTIEVKDLEKTEAALSALSEIVGFDATEEMIKRLNLLIEESYPQLDKITKLEQMNKQHYGMIGRLIAQATNQAEKAKKEKK
ncbi:TPA: DUF1071 domain-containing protein [Enterococcus faecalis]|nr:DUF1071 domain-containing protein [Enterococcus faecalis]